MLYDYACTPQIFDINDDSAKAKDLIHFLYGVIQNGMLADLNNGDWKKEVISIINNLPEKYKDKFSALYKNLKDKNLIIPHIKADFKPKSEEEWIELAQLSETIKPFYSIIGTQEHIGEVKSLEEFIISDEWLIERVQTKYIIQSEERLRLELESILSYAKKVVLIDPYFNVKTQRYRKTLYLVAEYLRSQRGNNQKGSIEIHTRYEQGKTDTKDYIDAWKKSQKDIFQKFGHTLALYQWDDTSGWHDRFLITDQCGVQVGAGLDVRNEGKSTWTKLDYEILYEILRDYKENSSNYTLKLKI